MLFKNVFGKRIWPKIETNYIFFPAQEIETQRVKMVSPEACIFIYFVFIFVYYIVQPGTLHFFNISFARYSLFTKRKNKFTLSKYLWLDLKLVLIFNNYSASPTQCFCNFFLINI